MTSNASFVTPSPLRARGAHRFKPRLGESPLYLDAAEPGIPSIRRPYRLSTLGQTIAQDEYPRGPTILMAPLTVQNVPRLMLPGSDFGQSHTKELFDQLIRQWNILGEAKGALGSRVRVKLSRELIKD